MINLSWLTPQDDLQATVGELALSQYAEVDVRRRSEELDVNWVAYADGINAGAAHCLVAYSEEQVAVGYLMFFVAPSLHTGCLTAYMDSMYVSPSHRDQDIGRQMLNEYQQMAGLLECSTITVTLKQGVDADNLLYGFGAVPSDITYVKVL